MLEVGQLSLVHVRSVVLWKEVRLRVYDLSTTRTGMPSSVSENVSDLVVQTFRGIWNLEVMTNLRSEYVLY